MIDLSLKMLFGDRAKYFMLVSGLTFASLLMIEQASIFCGVMQWSGSTLHNVPAPIWVVDPMVEQVNDTDAMRDTDINRVRSVPGVEWAAPLYSGTLRARLPDGSFKFIQLMGIDSATFAGAPRELVSGSLDALRMPNTVIIDESGSTKLSRNPDKPLAVGDVFEINDREARVVGVCKARMSFQGNPYVFTTYDRALLYAPSTRKMLSCVLAAPRPGETAASVAQRITEQTGLKAHTTDDFFWLTMWWFVKNTGIPVAFGATVIVGLVVGMVICSQTFYSFVLENLRNLGALKAMGASDATLRNMLLVQALTVGVTGYGCGAGLATAFGWIVIDAGQPPFFMPWSLPVATLITVLVISGLAAGFGIRRIQKLEAAVVFRG